MKAFIKSLAAIALLSLASGVARADDDGFSAPQAAPTQHVATSDLPATGRASSGTQRAWSPASDSTSQSAAPPIRTASQPVAMTQNYAAQRTVPQTRYASQNSPSQPLLSDPAPQSAAQFQPPQAQPVQQQQQRLASQPPQALQQQAQPQPQAAPQARYSTQTAPPDLAPSRGSNSGYHLGAGDKIRIIVYGEDDLGGEFEVDGSGYVRLPLVGQVQAAGLTVRDFEGQIATRLSDGYLRDPKVSAEVTTYRPFYIIGEVNKPGEYAYVNGMNVVTAVALAGGFTYRASDDDVYVRRNGSRREEELPANERTIIYPGDIIRVTERFF